MGVVANIQILPNIRIVLICILVYYFLIRIFVITPMVTDFKKKKKGITWETVLLHVGGVLSMVILVFLILANINMYQKHQEFLSQVENLKNQIKDTEVKNKTLTRSITMANNEQYIEEVAREELDLQREGEQVVSFVMSQSQVQKSNDANQDAVRSWLGWLSGAWQWVFNLFL